MGTLFILQAPIWMPPASPDWTWRLYHQLSRTQPQHSFWDASHQTGAHCFDRDSFFFFFPSFLLLIWKLGLENKQGGWLRRLVEEWWHISRGELRPETSLPEWAVTLLIKPGKITSPLLVSLSVKWRQDGFLPCMIVKLNERKYVKKVWE